MLADPQSITLSQGAKTAPRLLTGTARGRFASSDGTAIVEVETTSTGSRLRTIARAEDRKVATDPLTESNIPVTAGVTLTINRPVVGFSETDVLNAVKGLIGWLTASTDANLKKIIAGEN